MRGALLLTLGLLLAGCTGPGGADQFRTLALRAPSLLEAAAGPGGDLAGYSGTMTVGMQMSMGEREMSMTMPTHIELELFQGGAYLMEMTMSEATVNGQRTPMDVRMRLFCSPEVIQIDGQARGEPIEPSTTENTIGFCPVTEEETARLSQADLDAHMQESMGPLLDQATIPKLSFKSVERDGGSNVAVYEYTMDMAMEGMSLHFTVETRSHLENGRITSMDLAGTGTMGGDAGGQDMDADITMSGHIDYRYGTRAPVPAEFA